MLQNDQQELHLHDITPRIFRLFMAWLYAGRLVTPEEALREQEPVKQEDSEGERPAWSDIDLTSLYLFGRSHRIRQLQNDVVTALFREHNHGDRFMAEDAVRSLWAHGGAQSHLGRLVLQERALYGLQEDNDIPKYFETMPASFLVEVLREVARLNAWRAENDDCGELPDPSRLHEHRKDAEEERLCREALARA